MHQYWLALIVILAVPQPPPAPCSKGVCGAAARTQQTQLVPDVHAFPGHIACASSTQVGVGCRLVVGCVDSVTRGKAAQAPHLPCPSLSAVRGRCARGYARQPPAGSARCRLRCLLLQHLLATTACMHVHALQQLRGWTRFASREPA